MSFRWDAAFLARLDEARGLAPRSAYVRQAVEAWMGAEGYEVWDFRTRAAMARRPGYPTLKKPGVPGRRGKPGFDVLIPEELIERVDAARGELTREQYVERAAQDYLAELEASGKNGAER